MTNPTTVVIAIATASVFTPVLARLFYRERLRALGWAAIALAFTGICIMTLWDGAMDLNVGVVWCTGAALSLAFYNLLQRNLSRSYSPLQINAWSFFISFIPMLVFLPDAARAVMASPWWKTVIVIYMGIFPSAIAYLFWVKALAIAPKTSFTTNYMFLTPLLTAVLEFVLMRQFPDAPTLVGGAVILASLALFSYAGRKG
ncbi:MAG: DMT family transporter [Planctomycetaceae bacterium]|nr:DMT family transporter [Planctomycetaceae bacterium]